MTAQRGRPRWGYASDGLDGADAFTLGRAGELAAAIGVEDPGRVQELQTELNECADWYRFSRQHDGGPSPADVRAALDALRKPLLTLTDRFEALDEATRLYLLRAFRRTRRAGEPWPVEAIHTARASLQRLLDAVTDARRRVPRKLGRPGQGALKQLALDLARLYERWSDSRFSYDVHGDRFLTAGAGWVEQAIRHIDPDVADANLRTAMRGLPKRIKDLQKPSP